MLEEDVSNAVPPDDPNGKGDAGHRRRWAASDIVLALAVIFWFGGHTVGILTVGMYFADFPTDGAFQFFNPLRRIAAAQTGGVDFQVFHGLGIPYVSYPLFVLFGKTLFASELTRYLGTALAFAVSLVVFVFRVTGDIRHRLLMIVLAIATIDPSLFFPGNSLIGVRSATSLIFAALLMVPMRPRWRPIVYGVVLAAAILLGTEHGLAITAGFVVTYALFAIRDRSWQPAKIAIASLAVQAVAASSAWIAIGGFAGMRGALRYAFRDAMADQFWYFGAPPNYFIHKWQQFLLDPYIVSLVPLALILLGGIVVWAARERDVEVGRRLDAMTVLLVYQLITCAAYLGIAYKTYLMPLQRAVVLAMLACGVLALPYLRTKLGPRALRLLRVGTAVVAATLFLQTIPDVHAQVSRAISIRRLYVAAGRKPLFSRRWSRDLAIASKVLGPPERHPQFWSTYSNIVEDRYGLFNPGGDYIIHALGERRPEYARIFRQTRPEYVQTVRNDLFQFEEWLRTMHWDFYQEVLTNYEVVAATSYSLWWKRATPMPLRRHQIGTFRPVEGEWTRLPLPRTTSPYAIVLVHLDYTCHNPWSFLPVVGQTPRYLVLSHGALNRYGIALPPQKNRFTVPLFITSGAQPVVQFTKRSLLFGPTLEVRSATVELVELPARAEKFLADRSPALGSGYVVPEYIFSSELQ